MPKSVVERGPELDIQIDLPEIIPYLDQAGVTDSKGRYLHWSQFKWRVPGSSQVLLWKATKFKRSLNQRNIGLHDEYGHPFIYCNPTSLEAALYGIVSSAQQEPSKVSSPAATHMTEAITSAQLEGAATPFQEAVLMLKEQREPTNEHEQMIHNSYLLMHHVEGCCMRELSVDMILDLHRIATNGTTENGVVPGQLRLNDQIFVSDGQGGIAHKPPSHTLLHERLRELCVFANTDHSGQFNSDFIHPIIKAITLHFMIGYDHPFDDGNGRTARALFYWFALKSKFNLFKYLSISKIIMQSHKAYGLAYLHTETDANDLTYFLYNQVEVITRAIKLHVAQSPASDFTTLHSHT